MTVLILTPKRPVAAITTGNSQIPILLGGGIQIQSPLQLLPIVPSSLPLLIHS